MDDKTLAAVTTPIRDLRDEVWVLVFAERCASLLDHPTANDRARAELAAEAADRAVEHMPIPAHRKPENA